VNSYLTAVLQLQGIVLDGKVSNDE